MTSSKHSVYSPSGAHRWVNCPASIQTNIHLCSEGVLVESESSKYAQEGTIAHEIAAEALLWQQSVKPRHFEGDDVEAIERYVEYVNWLKDEDDDTALFVELETPIPAVNDECFGTVDAAVISDLRMHVVDLKFGRQVPVNARDNMQMMMYASGLLDDELLFLEKPIDDFEIILHIHMPRVRYYPKNFDAVWKTTAGYIRATMREVREAALVIDKQIEAGGVPTKHFNPSEKTCQWCNNKPVCSHYSNLMIDDFDDLDADSSILPNDELESIFLRSKAIVSYLGSVEAHILQVFGIDEEHDDFPKLCVRSGRGTSVWANEKDVIQAFKDKELDAYDKPSLKGITAARKELKDKDLVNGLIKKMPGSPKLMEK